MTTIRPARLGALGAAVVAFSSPLRAQTPKRFVADTLSALAADAVLHPGFGARTIDLSGPFGFVRQTTTQEGRTLRVTMAQGGARGILPPDRVDDLIARLEEIQRVSRTASTVAVIRR